MDRGIPTEATLATMREGDAPAHYLVGTPKGRLTKLEKSFLGQPWQAVRPRVASLRQVIGLTGLGDRLHRTG